MDYSKTVNLPKTDFPMKADLAKREPEMLTRWAAERVYEKALEARHGKPPFILHDGPPYANGHLHLGHALNKILKDIIVRSKTMAGYYSPYVPGWDCHGLPIELALMKEKKITDKHQVDREAFRRDAGAFAQRFVDIQREEFKRMGILGDWDHPYLTMAPAFKDMIVKSFQELEKKGFVYRGKKPVYWCATDETALAEAEVEYEDDKGPSIYVAFEADSPLPNVDGRACLPAGRGQGEGVKTFFVIWTTTPWTLPANVAIAVHPTENYVLWEVPLPAGRQAHPNGEGGLVRYILAEKLLESFQKSTGLSGKTVTLLKGLDLIQVNARHPWIKDRLVRVLPADFVAMDTGTGLVHIAPGHGREDFVLGQKHKLPVLSPVSDRGLFTDEVPEWKGQYVLKANANILEFLKEKGVLLYSGEITHSYPHCWRCHKPVIFRATEQWFLDIDKKMPEGQTLRDRLLEVIAKDVKWIPGYGENRISGMVAARPDWCLSRQRLWGTEIPSGAQGSGLSAQTSTSSEPRALSPEPDIFDVWFESGVSWAAVLKNKKEWPNLQYPADLYLEGSDQHRGWFQVSLIPSVALENQAPFKAVLTHGFVMDGEGRPMSKSLGNVIAPEQIIKQYGADVLRLWVAASDYGGDVRLSQDILKNQAEAYRKVRNTFRYLLNNLNDFTPAMAKPFSELPEIDQWALHRLQEEIRDARSSYDAYQFNRVVSRLVTFCGTDLSSFYLDVIKDRLYCDPADSSSRRSAQTVLFHMADALIRLLAPILSFTMDECWRFMGHMQSIAMEDFPTVNPSFLNDALAKRWEQLFAMRESVQGELEKARAAGRIKAPREARVTIRFAQAQSLSFFKEFSTSLASAFGVSRVDLEPSAANADVEIHVDAADGAKCSRCWVYKSDIGKDARYSDICERCAQAIDALPQDILLLAQKEPV